MSIFPRSTVIALGMIFFSIVPTLPAQEFSAGPLSRFISRIRQRYSTSAYAYQQAAAPAPVYQVAAAPAAVAEESATAPAPVNQEAAAPVAVTQEPATAPAPVHQEAAAPAAAAEEPATSPSSDGESPGSSDPYGFGAILNWYRAAAGLPPVVYDPSLSSWAGWNNAAQCWRGLGHYVNPCGVQNCGWNYADAQSVAQGWMNSSGHRQNMLSPSISSFGIAYGPGPYWTLIAR